MSDFFITEPEARQARLDSALGEGPGFGGDQNQPSYLDTIIQGAEEGLSNVAAGGMRVADVFANLPNTWLETPEYLLPTDPVQRAATRRITDPNFGRQTDLSRYLTETADFNRARASQLRNRRALLSQSHQMVGGFSSMLSSTFAGALLGPGGAASTLATGTGEATYSDLRQQGVGETTAFGAALQDAGFMAFAATLPASLTGRLWQRALSGAALNAGVGAAQRGAMNAYLQSEGYEDVAAQYQWLDPTATAVDVVLGAVFGAAFGHSAPSRPRETIDPDTGQSFIEDRAPQTPEEWLDSARQYAQDSEPDFAEAYAHALIAQDQGHPEADGVLAMIEEDASAADLEQGRGYASEYAAREIARELRGSEIADAAMVEADALHAEIGTAPGLPADRAARAAHSRALEQAREQMARDERVDVTSTRVEDQEFVERPRNELEMEEAIRQYIEDEGLSDRLSELEAAQERARQRGLDPDMLFSFGARRRTGRGVDPQRGTEAFSDARLTASENKAVEMARNNYSNVEIADEMNTSTAVVAVWLSKARRKIGDIGVESGIGAGRGGRQTDWSTDQLIRLRDQLLQAGLRVGRTAGTDRTIYKVMSERTGISVNTINARLSKAGALFSLAQANARAGRASVEELNAVALEEFGAAWESLQRAGLAEIVQDKASVPSERGLPRGVQAVHMRGADKSFFIANNISPEDLRGLILHELGVHHGMEEMLGARGKRELLRQVRAMADAGHPDVERALAFAKADNPGRPEIHDEEALAYLVEMQADLPIVQSLLSRVRQWLIKTFGSTFGMRLTVADLRALTVSSLRQLSERARREAADMTPVDPLYSQAPDVGNAGQFWHSSNRLFDRFEPRTNRSESLGSGVYVYDDEALAGARGQYSYGVTTDGQFIDLNNPGSWSPEVRQELLRNAREGRPELDSAVAIEALQGGAGARLRELGYVGARTGNERVIFDAADARINRPPNAPARGSDESDFPLFSMGARGQNRDNLLGAKRDPIESPDYQRRVEELSRRLGGYDPGTMGAEGGREGGAGGEDNSPPKDGDAPDRILGKQAREVLSVSGVRFITQTGNDMGALRIEVDAPIDLPVRLQDALIEQADERAHNVGIDFDLVEGGKNAGAPDAMEGRRDGVYIRYTSVTDALKKSGVGFWLYRQLIDWAHRRGHAAYSDAVISKEAWGVYDRLREAGYEVTQVNAYLFDGKTYAAVQFGEPIWQVRQSYAESAYEAAPAPRDDYKIDGPTLRQRQQAAKDAGAEGMLFSMGSRASRRFRAAMRDPETGEIYLGLDHMEAIESAPDGARERLDAIYRAPIEDSKAVGSMVDGKFMSREDGMNAMREMRQRERQQADAYAKLEPVEQAIVDNPSMEIPGDLVSLGRMGAFKGTARELLDAARANMEAQREMGKGFEAAARCAVRHGGSAAGRSFTMAGANAATQSTTIMLGQALGLVASVPATIALAPALARDSRRVSPQAREDAETAYAASRAAQEALYAMDRARESADVLGMD
ncbi:MAG TPA: hypothetical protein VM915_14865, partial [Verrucomicrobiae bacterium]|nr:hypothetical protein [Verrucomicrobiae bacterium]